MSDHIRAMSNEELGKKLVGWYSLTVEARSIYAMEAAHRLNASPVAEVPSVEEIALTLINSKRRKWGFIDLTMEELMAKGQDSASYPEAQAIHALLIQRQGGRIPPEQIAEKIVTDWLAEVGSDEHGLEWDDLADLKTRIAKELRGEP